MAKIGSWEWWQQNQDTPCIALAKAAEAQPVSVDPAVRALQAKLPVRNPKNEIDAVGYVYYVGDGHNRIKIGFSTNPWSRLKEMKTANPSVKILAIERGTRRLEDQRHAQFKADHITREWFTLSENIEDWIGLLEAPHTIMKCGDDFDAKQEIPQQDSV